MKSNIPYKFLIAASVVLSLTFCSMQSKHQSVPSITPKEQQHIIRETQCLKEVIFHEARGEPLEGQLAVLSVVQNRKNSGKYPSTFCGVIRQKSQFSYRNGKGQGLIKTPYKPSEELIRATIAHWAFTAAVGSFKGTVEDSVMWYSLSKIKPKWSTGMIKYVTIKNHSFYFKGIRHEK